MIDSADRVWVTDACNHRVQVFDASGSEAKLVKSWGEKGHAPGQLHYPYDILLDDAALAGQPDGCVYLCEFGNHRVQKFTLDGEFVGLLGRERPRAKANSISPGASPATPSGRMFVLDSYNHRVQRFRL